MSVRFTNLDKATLDALAARANGYFGGSPPGGAASFAFDTASEYDITVGGTEGDIYVDTDGKYYLCDVDADPGIPLTHEDYFTPQDPAWEASLRDVRRIIGAAYLAAADGAADCAAAKTILEAGVISGPWPVAEGFFYAGALAITAGYSHDDAASRASGIWWHGLMDLWLYSYQDDCRLDVLAEIVPGHSQILTAYEDAHNEFYLKLSWGPDCYVSGEVSVGCAYTATPSGPPDITFSGAGDPYYDSVSGRIIWTFDGATLLSEIDLLATIQVGDANWQFEGESWTLALRWPGSTAEVADRVIANDPVYRSGAASPNVQWEVFQTESGVTTHHTYADGANMLAQRAVPVNYSPSDRKWMVRARSLPAYGIAVGVAVPATGDWLQPRAAFPCRRLADASAFTATDTEGQILEVAHLFATRFGAGVDQHRPVQDFADAAGTRASLSAAVKYLRDGDPTPVDLSETITVGATRMWSWVDLGRAQALIAFAPLPLRWDQSRLWLSADGLLAVGVPCAASGWSWTLDAVASPAALFAYHLQAAETIDDLVAAMDAMDAAV